MSASVSFAQQPPIAPTPPPTPVTPPAGNDATCGGEKMLRIEVDRAKDVTISTYRPAGATAWLSDLTLTGKVMLSSGRKPCNASGVRISAEESEMRSALQTCAIIGASVGPGQRLFVNVTVPEGARAQPAARLLVTKPSEIICGID
jgi:hypothetical protein